MLDAVQLSHLLVQSRLHPRGVAVDATAGNGHDTLFLARRLGPGGHVHAFDIQAQALDSTRCRLATQVADMADVHLHRCGHEEAAAVLAEHQVAGIDAAMFNLGYLPGGEKTLTTQPGTTVKALSELTQLLIPHGILSVVAYVGHAGGLEERNAVLEWSRSLGGPEWATWRYTALNEGLERAELVVIERLETAAR